MRTIKRYLWTLAWSALSVGFFFLVFVLYDHQLLQMMAGLGGILCLVQANTVAADGRTRSRFQWDMDG